MTTSRKKTVLITGAAKRVGRALALSMAKQGWNIVVHYHTSEKDAMSLAKQLQRMKCAATLVQADLSDAVAVSRIIPMLAEQRITLDCLINNASQFEKDNIATFTPESWNLHMSVNTLAPLLLIQDFVAQYSGSEGNIINITDGMTDWSVSPTFLTYALSKQSLHTTTQLLARSLAPSIRINTVAPGPTIEGKQDKKDTFEKLRHIIPLGRTSSVQEVCDTISYILSAPSITGQTIALSGGIYRQF